MGVLFGWIIFSIVVGFIGSNRKIGFWGAFFLSLLLSPVIGLIIALVSKNKEDEKYRQKVLKTQKAQKVALEKLSDKKTVKKSSISIADELEKLQKLKEKNVISETEYTKLKNNLINSSDVSLIKPNDTAKIETSTENDDSVDIAVFLLLVFYLKVVNVFQVLTIWLATRKTKYFSTFEKNLNRISWR